VDIGLCSVETTETGTDSVTLTSGCVVVDGDTSVEVDFGLKEVARVDTISLGLTEQAQASNKIKLRMRSVFFIPFIIT